MIFGILAVVGLLGVIFAKFYTTNQSQKLRLMIATTQSQNNKIKGELKLAESTKSAMIYDLNVEERKLRVLKAKISKYDRDLTDLKK